MTDSGPLAGTTARRLTAPGMAAVMVVEVQGPPRGLTEGIPVLAGPLPDVGRLRRTVWRDPATGAALDDILLVRWSEDAIEVHAHGGPAVRDAIRATLETTGARWLEDAPSAPPDDDLPGVLAHLLLEARSPRAAQWLLAQREVLPPVLERIAGGESPEAILAELAPYAGTARAIERQPVVPLVGVPNAGKSTLFNALMEGRTAQLTHAAPGTTRDAIAEPLWVRGFAVALTDGPGLRSSDDIAERRGVRQFLASFAVPPDLALIVLDAAAEPAPDVTRRLVEGARQRAVTVVVAGTKTDRGAAPGWDAGIPADIPRVAVSGVTGAGLGTLLETVAKGLHLAESEATYGPLPLAPIRRLLLQSPPAILDTVANRLCQWRG